MLNAGEEDRAAVRHRRVIGLVDTFAHVGDDSTDRLRKLLDAFVYRDLSGLTVKDAARIGDYLARLVSAVAERVQAPLLPSPGTSPRWDAKASPEGLRAVQRALREAVEAVAAGRYERVLREAVIVAGRLPQPLGRVLVSISAPFADAVIYAALLLMAEVPPNLLRRCFYQLPGPGPLCLRIFVGWKRQKWCADHQEAARRDRDRRAQTARRERLEKKLRRKRPRRKR